MKAPPYRSSSGGAGASLACKGTPRTGSERNESAEWALELALVLDCPGMSWLLSTGGRPSG